MRGFPRESCKDYPRRDARGRDFGRDGYVGLNIQFYDVWPYHLSPSAHTARKHKRNFDGLSPGAYRGLEKLGRGGCEIYYLPTDRAALYLGSALERERIVD
jgi:hypothetical protein